MTRKTMISGLIENAASKTKETASGD